ncbi:hypothetical protein AN478_02265 [Thiohalorhabdus denitrificans]|nr:O-antigen ligase family protein [Thiohalorhabdus denitrificans]KPV41422.1 hypothetical protein AN478_02265 [Thiohalorhabdus denitrificans]
MNSKPYFPVGSLEYDLKRLYLIAVFSAGSLALLASNLFRQRARALWQAIPRIGRLGLILFFVLGLPSAGLAAKPQAALLEWAWFLALFQLSMAVAAALELTPRTGAGILMVGLLGGITAYSGGFMDHYVWATWVRGNSIEWIGPFGRFANVRFFSQVQTLTLPLLAATVLLAARFSRTLFWLLAVIAAFWFAMLFATGTRGTWVGVLGAMVILVFFPRAWAWQKVNLSLLTGGGLLYFLIFSGQSPGVERTASKLSGDPSGESRLQLWEHALDAIAQAPWLGQGPMHYALGGGPPGSAHPHNSLLQIGSEWGLPALFLLVILSAWGLLRFFRQETGQLSSAVGHGGGAAQIIHTALLASLLAGLGHSLVSGIIVMPASQFLLAVIAASLWSYEPLPKSVKTASLKGGGSAAFLGIVALPPILIMAITFPHIPQLHKAETLHQELIGPRNPRFWLQGRLEYPPWTDSYPGTRSGRESNGVPRPDAITR